VNEHLADMKTYARTVGAVFARALHLDNERTIGRIKSTESFKAAVDSIKRRRTTQVSTLAERQAGDGLNSAAILSADGA